MQEIIDRLSAKVASQEKELEAYRELIERKNRALKSIQGAIVEILGDVAAQQYIFGSIR